MPLRRRALAARGQQTREFEADRAAQGSQLGRTNLGFGLRPAPAAHVHVPGSRTEPLERRLCETLSHSFGVDLRPIRVHRDPAAADAAAAYGARAFTAGADLYFAGGAYAPGSQGGEWLIAHEVAHAIQQAGRSASAGLALDANVRGGAMPQLADDFATAIEAQIKKDVEFWETITFDHIVDAHSADAANADQFGTFFVEVAEDLGLGPMEDWAAADWSKLDPVRVSAFTRDLPRYVKKYPSEFSKKSKAGYGFYYDCLKKLGNFTAAFELLEAQPEMRTVASHVGLLAQLNTERGLALFNADATVQQLVKAFLRDLPIRVTAMLLAPSRGFYAHQLKYDAKPQTLGEAYDSVLKRASEGTATGENELIVSAFMILQEIEQSLQQPLTKAPAAATVPLAVRRAFSAGVEQYGSSLQSATAEQFGRLSVAVKAKAGSLIETAARQVTALWDAVTGDAKLEEDVREALVKDPTGADVGRSVHKHAKALFARERDGRLPSPHSYRSRVKEFNDRLMGLVTGKVEPALLKLARKDAAELALPSARALAWLLRWLYDAFNYVSGYSVEEDNKFVSRWQRDDVRGAHRIIAARTTLALGEMLDNNDLRTLSRDVVLGLDRHPPGNQVFLLSDWQVDEGADWMRLGEELPGHITGAGGVRVFTGASLTLLMRLVVLSARVRALTQLLAEQTTAQQPLHRKVDRMLAGIEVPQRWVVHDVLFSVRPPQLTDEGAKSAGVAKGTRIDELTPEQVENVSITDTRFPPGEQPGDLVMSHPKTEQQVIPFVRVDEGWDFVVPSGNTSEVFGWLIPPVAGLCDILRQIEAFNAAVVRVEAVTTSATPSDEWVGALTDLEWTTYLLRAMTEPLVEGPNGLRVPVLSDFDALLRIEDETRTRYEKTDVQYVTLLKAAAARQRVALVAEQLAILTKDDQSLEARLTYARNTLIALDEFRIEAFPYVRHKKDPTIVATTRTHLALAMLALAEALNARIESAEDDRLIVGYLRLIDETSEFLGNRPEWIKQAGVGSLGDLLAPGEAEKTLLAGAPALLALRDRLREGRHQAQLRRGFRGQRKTGDEFSGLNAVLDILKAPVPGSGYSMRDLSDTIKAGKDKDDEFLNGVTSDWEIAAGDEFTIDGEEYLLIEVHRPFIYFPSFAGPTTTAYRPGVDPAFAPPIVLDGYESSVGEAIEESVSPITDRTKPLISVLHDGRQRTLYPPRVATREEPYTAEEMADIFFLDRFSHAVTMRSLTIGMEKLGENVEFFGELMVEVVATIFGMQGAKTAVDALMLTQSDEITQLVEQLQNDPVKFVRDVLAQLKDEFLTPEHFIKVMLFPTTGAADAAFGTLERLSQPKGTAPKPGPGSKPKTSIGRVIRSLVELGKHVAGSLVRLHKRIQGPMGGMRSGIALHPKLANALSLIVTYGPIVITVATALKEEYDRLKQQQATEEIADFEGLVNLAAAGLRDGADTLSSELNQVMETLATLEIPTKIVPLLDLVSMIGDLVIKVLARSGKAKIANKIAGALGVKQKAYEKAAQAIDGSVFDPNYHWADKVIPLFQDEFDKIKREFVAALETGLSTAAESFNEVVPSTLGVKIQLKSTAEVKPTPFEGNYAEFVPYREQEDSRVTVPPLRVESDGVPMAEPMRRAAESRFKHDFSHVRLHGGSEGERTTRAARALALTSGSHVWINPAVTLSDGRGLRILDHELTHVLQQAGPRPLGSPHPSAPLTRRGDRGVVIDREGEREAARIAEMVQRGTDAPVDVRGEDPDAFAPAAIGTGLVFDFVALMSNYKDTADFQDKIDKAAAGKPPKDVPGLATANALWAQVETALGKKESYAATFTSVRAAIVTQVQRSQAAIRKAIPHIAADAQRPDKDAMEAKVKADLKAGRRKSIAKQVYQLDPKPFMNLLSGYVFTRTGVAINVTLDLADWKKPKVASVRVEYLNLGRVPPGDELWTKLGNKLQGVDQREMQVRLSTLDPLPGVWDTTAYKLDADYLKKYERWRERRAKYGRPPLASEYIAGKLGNTLAIGTHQTLTGKTDNTTERESHHTTQFLLIQYFSNAQKKKKPFFKNLPGVEFEGNVAKSFKAPGRGKIDIAPLFEGDRGGPMPAILLSREAHRQGKLHIDRAHQWVPEGAKSDKSDSATQAFMLDSQYKSRLAKAGFEAAASKETFDEKRPALGTDRDIQLAVYNAITGTYAWMHEAMTRALQYALPRNELAFYAGWVARHEDLIKAGKPHKDYVLDVELLSKTAYADALRNDAQIMSRHGWMK